MAKLSTEELLDAFKELSLLELSEFIKAFEEEFDVTAAAPVAMAAAPAGGGEDTGEAEEQTEFDVVLESAGDAKIGVIKEVRALTSLGLKDAKDLVVVVESGGDGKMCVVREGRALASLGLRDAEDLVDGAPKPVLEGVDKAAADAAKEPLEGAGATVTLK